MLFLGQRLMRGWFHLVARQKSLRALRAQRAADHARARLRSRELAGLSLALGAFLAGMLISETEYRYQVEDDIKPFRDVLLGLFFVTDRHAARLAGGDDERRLGRCCCSCCSLALKVVADRRAVRARSAHRPAWRCAPASRSAQAGEFGSCCSRMARERSCVPGDRRRWCWPAMVLSMLIAPSCSIAAPRIVRRFIARDWMHRAMEIHNIAVRTMARRRSTSSSAATAGAARTSRACSKAEDDLLHRARPRSRARPGGGGSGRERGVRRCGAPRGAGGRRARCARTPWW